MLHVCSRQQHRVYLHLFGVPGLGQFLFPRQEIRGSKTTEKEKQGGKAFFLTSSKYGWILLIPCIVLKHIQLDLKIKL